MAVLTDFIVEASAGILGVFAGVVLALWTERKRRAHEEARQAERLDIQLADIRDVILSSVVRNTFEAKRLQGLLVDADDPYLFGSAFELAIWEATHEQFVQLASLEQRVLLTRFFDQVRRLMRLIDFQRQVRADVEVRVPVQDAGDRALLEGITSRLKTVAEDMRLDGIVIVADHGGAMHKRLLGLGDSDTVVSNA